VPASPKRIVIVAGPNGAGKTTFAREFLPQEADCPTFVNADVIADGLSPFDPARVAIRSGRIMLQLIREHAERGETFAFETTLAERNYARSIWRWRAARLSRHTCFVVASVTRDDPIARGRARPSGGPWCSRRRRAAPIVASVPLIPSQPATSHKAAPQASGIDFRRLSDTTP
jgi:hypothetical protein